MWWSKNKKEKKTRSNKTKVETSDSTPNYLQQETLRAIVAVVFFVLGLFFVLSAFNKGGMAGEKIFQIFSSLFGIGYYLLPILFFILCLSFFNSVGKKLARTKTIGGLLFFVSSLSLINISLPGRGGVVGGFISKPLLNIFDAYASIMILGAMILISLFWIS